MEYMKFFYKHINRTILDGNVMNMSLIITEGKYGAIDTDDSSCHDYYIIMFFSSTYALQSDLIIDGQVISYGEMTFKENYFFPININSHYYVLQRTKSMNTIVSLRTTNNGNTNVLCYHSKYVVPLFLNYI